MGKKKKKNVDFQKVKLKVGKHLPKGLNVTDTSFKTRKIVLPNQLKSSTEGIPSSSQQNVQDLIKKLRHYNPSNRHETLIRLKDTLSQNTELILASLSSIVQCIAEIMLDKEWVVRRSVLQVLTVVLQNVKEHEIAPFFQILCSYLSCAMTHILVDIKHDSLSIFNLLLDKFPNLLLKSSREMLQNFLNQISSQKQDARNNSSSRMLSITPSGKITDQAWRLSVLRRLEKFLGALVDQHDATKIVSRNATKEVFWDCKERLRVPLYDVPNLTSTSSGIPNTMDTKEIQNYVSSIMPLLFETWVESSLQEKSSAEIAAKAEVSEVLECTLHIMQLVAEWVENASANGNELVEWFRKTYYPLFNQFFMPGFPFAPQSSSHSRKRKRSENKTVSQVAVNLLACSFYIFIADAKDVAPNEANLSKIHGYLKNLVDRGESLEKAEVAQVVKMVKRILAEERDGLSLPVVVSLLSLYHKCSSSLARKQLLFDFFVELLLQSRFQWLHESEDVCLWIQNLPAELITLKSNPNCFKQCIKAINKLAARKMPSLLDGLQYHAENIIDLISAGPSWSGASENCQWEVLELVTKIPYLPLPLLKRVVQVVCASKIALRDLKCFLQILSYRYEDQPDVFINFVLSIVVGATNFRYATAIPFDDELYQQIPQGLSNFKVDSCSTEVWEDHMQKVQVLGSVLSHFTSKDITRNTNALLTIILKKEEPFPVYAACGIVLLFIHYLDVNDTSKNEDYKLLAELVISLWLHSFMTKQGDTSKQLELDDEIEDLTLMCIEKSKLADAISQKIWENIDSFSSVDKVQWACHWILEMFSSCTCENNTMAMICRIMQIFQANSSLSATPFSQEPWWQAVLYELSLAGFALPNV